MKYPKRSQYKYAKSPYRIRNWPEYEAGLRRRGDLTLWLSDDAISSWRALPSGKPGGQRTFVHRLHTSRHAPRAPAQSPSLSGVHQAEGVTVVSF